VTGGIGGGGRLAAKGRGACGGPCCRVICAIIKPEGQEPRVGVA